MFGLRYVQYLRSLDDISSIYSYHTLKVIAFIEEKTTRVVEKTLMKKLEFPQVIFCPKSALKSEELVAMGRAAGVNFTEDFLKPQMLPYNSNFNLTDIDEIWKNGTYQKGDFGLQWMVEDGKLRLDEKVIVY